MKNRIGIVLLGAMLLAGTASLPVRAINHDSTDGKYWRTVDFDKHGELEIMSYYGVEEVVNIPDYSHYLWANAFVNNVYVKEVHFPHDYNIYSDAFAYCSNLENVTFEGSNFTIWPEAFLGCNISRITIPDSVTEIGDYAFGYDYVGENGWTLKKDDFVIYCNEGSEAERYAIANGIEYVLPGGCEHVWGDAVKTLEPTEYESGINTYTCMLCDAQKTEEIPSLICNHAGKKEIRNHVDKACKKEGYTGDLYCADCGELLETGEPIKEYFTHYYIDRYCYRCGVSEYPDPPKLKSIQNTTKGIKITWEEPIWDNPDETLVYYCAVLDENGDIKETLDYYLRGNSAELTRLESGKTYRLSIGTNGEDDNGYPIFYPNYDKKGLTIKYLDPGKPSSLTNSSKGITVKWKKIAGAKGYYVYRKSGSGDYKRIAEINSGSTTSYLDTAVKDKNGSEYTYTIRAYNGSYRGSYQGKKVTRLKGVTFSSLKNPSKGAIKVTWKKQSKVTGYEIQYSTSSSFKSGNKSVKVKGASTLNKTIKKLKKGKTYYVRVRGYKTKDGRTDYSAWSAKRSIRIRR